MSSDTMHFTTRKTICLDSSALNHEICITPPPKTRYFEDIETVEEIIGTTYHVLKNKFTDSTGEFKTAETRAFFDHFETVLHRKFTAKFSENHMPPDTKQSDIEKVMNLVFPDENEINNYPKLITEWEVGIQLFISAIESTIKVLNEIGKHGQPQTNVEPFNLREKAKQYPITNQSAD